MRIATLRSMPCSAPRRCERTRRVTELDALQIDLPYRSQFNHIEIAIKNVYVVTSRARQIDLIEATDHLAKTVKMRR